jgi:hypothetical protein
VALAGLAVATIAALPLAVASAGPLGEAGRAVARMSGLAGERALAAEGGSRYSGARHDGTGDTTADDGKAPGGEWHAGGLYTGEERHAEETGGAAEAQARSRSPLPLGIGHATATRCGAELSSPDGVEAQTCVLTQGDDIWARTYYRNATGEEQSLVLSLMAPDGGSTRMHCAAGAQDEPGVCETPRERTQGSPETYMAVAEFAAHAGHGPLLLRADSDSPESTRD